MAEIAGLKLIVPSSVAGSGVSVSASGKVTFTAATSVSVNGCFSATYDNYLVVVRSSSSDSWPSLDVRMRASGTDATGSNYTYQNLIANGSSVTGARTTQSEFLTGASSSTARSGMHLYLYGPFLAQPTAFRNVDVDGNSSASIVDRAGTHSLSTSYDGFTVKPNSGNITGALTIYGLSQ